MLSYLHSFHAGNHADVIKHITLIALLDKLQQKPKPFFYLDTHAGDGAYDTQEALNKDPLLAADLIDLASRKISGYFAESSTQTTPDSNARIASSNTPAPTAEFIKQYIDIITPYLDKKIYPGSPLVAFEKISASSHIKNNLHLSEMHPSAFDGLKTWTKSSDFQLHKRDGFELLNALMPPKPNRGLVLIDPPYEQAQEYQHVIDAVANALKKWPQGTFAIWFPLLSPTRLDRKTKQISPSPKSGMSEAMLKQLASLATKYKGGMLEIRFVKQQPNEKVGMYGSGMAIMNPPWQFDTSISSTLNLLFQAYSAKSEHNSAVYNSDEILSFLKYWIKPE